MIALFAVFWLYFAGGMAINFLRGKEGDEIIPHHTLWVKLADKLQDFVGSATTKAKQGIEIVKEKVTKKSTNYEMV